MIKLISYIFAIVLSIALAIVLYPIAAVFWLLGLFGKISDGLFAFTKKVLSSIWRDIRNMGKSDGVNSTSESWQCSCGTFNTGKFCAECGASKPVVQVVEQDYSNT